VGASVELSEKAGNLITGKGVVGGVMPGEGYKKTLQGRGMFRGSHWIVDQNSQETRFIVDARGIFVIGKKGRRNRGQSSGLKADRSKRPEGNWKQGRDRKPRMPKNFTEAVERRKLCGCGGYLGGPPK